MKLPQEESKWDMSADGLAFARAGVVRVPLEGKRASCADGWARRFGFAGKDEHAYVANSHSSWEAPFALKATPLLLTALLLTGDYSARAGREEYELVLWNQYNGAARDRGTRTCKVEVFSGASVIWKVDRLVIPWSAGDDTKASVKFPKQIAAVDRIRVTILETIGYGGGLSEIELFRGNINIAHDSKVSASASYENDPRFSPDRVIDGITSSQNMFAGYWLLPNSIPKTKRNDWIELKLPRR